MSAETHSKTAPARVPVKKRILLCDELAPEAYEVFSERGYAAERCWELDAIDPNVLRERLTEQIETRTDLLTWEKSKVVETAEIGSSHEYW